MKLDKVELYTLRNAGHPGQYTITKFDKHLEPEASYLVSQEECACPRGEQHHLCRHRQMLPTFIRLKHVDDGYLLDFKTRQWQAPPLADEINDEQPPLNRPLPEVALAPEAQAVRDLPPPASASAAILAPSSGAPILRRYPKV